jgi:hypothetical protein
MNPLILAYMLIAALSTAVFFVCKAAMRKSNAPQVAMP